MDKPHKRKTGTKFKTAALLYKNPVQKEANFPRPSTELTGPSEASAVTAAAI